MKTFKQFNESVRDLMKPKSEEEIRNIIKNKINTDKNIISVIFSSPIGDSQWKIFRKELKNNLIKIEDLNNTFLIVKGDVIDVYNFFINYFQSEDYSYIIYKIKNGMII